MKLLRNNTRSILTLSLAGMLGIVAISCLPPVYHTAEVEPGTSFTVGVGAVAYDYCLVIDHEIGVSIIGLDGTIIAFEVVY